MRSRLHVGSRRRRGARILTLLALSPFLLPVTPASATTGHFTASIVGMDTALPAADDPILVDLQLANSTATAVNGVHARFYVALAPLRGRSEIPSALFGGYLPAYRTLGADAASGIDLPSGASTTLALRTSVKALGLANAAPGVYVMGLYVYGTTADGHPRSLRATTLLPWMAKPVGGRLGVSTFWTLTAPPSRGVDGVFMDDRLAKDLQAGGRLRQQLDTMATVADATWIVDPLLVEAVQTLAHGARIRQPNGDVRATTNAEMSAASQWITDLKADAAKGTLAALPLGDFDIRSAVRFGRITMARHALSSASQRLAAALGVTTAIPLVVPVYGGAITDSTWRLLDEMGASRVLVSDASYPAQQQTYTPTAALDVPAFGRGVLVTDQVASDAPITAALDETGRRQAFASQLLMTYLERPNSTRTIAIAINPTWTPQRLIGTANVLNAPWVKHVSAADAQAAGVDTRNAVQRGASPAQKRQNAAAATAGKQQTMLRLLTSDAVFSTQVDDTVVALFSTWWTQRTDGAQYARTLIDQLTALGASVRVVTRGDIVFGGERGNVPVTVANGLPVPVDIRLHAVGVPSVRVQSTAYTNLHLNAGKRVSVMIPTRVTGSGDAYLVLEVLAPDGTVVGGSAVLTVRSAAYARIAGYVVAVSFALLLVLIAMNTIRRMRARTLGLVEEE